MKLFQHVFTGAFLTLSLLAWRNSHATEKAVNWKLVSKNLVRALASENEGLRQSAMNFFVQHADKLDINDAVFDVMRIYRNHEDERVRMLALVTLYKMQHKWAMGFLKRDLKFQDSAKLKRMVAAILQDYQARKSAS
jgi:hypothetical protein